MTDSIQRKRSWKVRWESLPASARVAAGFVGSATVLALLWQTALTSLNWPPLGLVGQYFWESIWSADTYKAVLMTGFRSLVAVTIGFTLTLVMAVLTGRTVLGWVGFFFLLLLLQKIPAIAMVHVFVSSELGIGFMMTIALASTVVLTFSWLVLHHRARTLDPKEMFALRILGFRSWELHVYGILPHMGSAIGGTARLAMSIALIMVVLGEWQGVWSDGSIWQYGLGVAISRSYEAIHSEARVLAFCLWLGLLGILLDGLVQSSLVIGRALTGINLTR